MIESGDEASRADDRPLPSLSVVVTARDEAGAIETTVRRLLAQRDPDLEILVVDDRSTDGTGKILERLAADEGHGGRLAVIHNGSLPEGWLGKCHACHVGASRAHGEWLLFTDGDVALAANDLLARTVRSALRDRLDHVAVVPDMEPMPLLQAAVVAAFGQAFLIGTRTYEMEKDLRRGGGGVGAFNLVRRSAYDRIGGHELLRMDPGDDVKLGMLLKETGARQRIFDGKDLVKCPWQRGTRNVLRGLEKNAFSGCNYSVAVLLAFTALAVWLAAGPLASALLAGALFLAAGVSAAVVLGVLPFAVQMGLLVLGAALARSVGHPVRVAAAALNPVGVLLLLTALWNSALTTLARGGIVWRGDFYPLEALRRGLVRPGDGRRLVARAIHGG